MRNRFTQAGFDTDPLRDRSMPHAARETELDRAALPALAEKVRSQFEASQSSLMSIPRWTRFGGNADTPHLDFNSYGHTAAVLAHIDALCIMSRDAERKSAEFRAECVVAAILPQFGRSDGGDDRYRLSQDERDIRAEQERSRRRERIGDLFPGISPEDFGRFIRTHHSLGNRPDSEDSGAVVDASIRCQHVMTAVDLLSLAPPHVRSFDLAVAVLHHEYQPLKRHTQTIPEIEALLLRCAKPLRDFAIYLTRERSACAASMARVYEGSKNPVPIADVSGWIAWADEMHLLQEER